MIKSNDKIKMSNMKINNKLKIAFCITCMNRLNHLKKTLIRNIEDNELLGQVVFVLLDYNSSDGLHEWVKSQSKYIDNGLLVYFRTDTPTHYKRSHSRNLVFKLSEADIVCNLDADNYLGKGFAKYVLNEFENNIDNKIFITSNCLTRDAFGKVCVLKEDFIKVGGYDESLTGYGVEDIDLFYRLIKHGYKQIIFENSEFYDFVHHTNLDRVSQERIFTEIKDVYITYQTPFCIDFIVLYENFELEMGTLTNNVLCNFNYKEDFSNVVEMFFDERYRTMLSYPLIKKQWAITEENNNTFINIGEEKCQIDKDHFHLKKGIYYKISNMDILAEFVMNLSDGINFNTVKLNMNNKKISVNPDGFGKGFICRNFCSDKIEVI